MCSLNCRWGGRFFVVGHVGDGEHVGVAEREVERLK
jgi:hypothetical protein